MDPKIIALYDDFTHRHLDRRVFLERLTKLVGSSALALTLMSALQSDYANAAMVAEDNSRLSTAGVVIPGAAGAVKGYVARPVGSAKLAGNHRDPRESRAYPAYQGCGAARRARRLRGVGARLHVGHRRHA